MLKKITILSLLTVVCATFNVSQSQPLDTLLKKFERYRGQTLQEKIYGHVNQKFFLTGETLWFKIYVVDGTEHRPLDMSKVAYAEILDKTNFPVLQSKIRLSDGRGNGSFFLPASLSSGQYKIRIYTNWMKNFSPEFYFDEVFSIINPFVTPDGETNTPTNYTVDFFPEGGNLVSGIKSKIAFSIRNGKGNGANAKGWILDDHNDTIASFIAQKFGMGHFYMTPRAAQHYKAVLDLSGGRTFALPEVHAAGYVMYLKDSGDVIRVVVHASGVERENVLLFLHARQQITNAQSKFVQDQAVFEIPKVSMVDGISHFTLFNTRLQPICERLYFKYPARALNIDIETNQKVFAPRRKVSVTLNAKSSRAYSSANLSMSVYKIDSLSNQSSMHIYPYLWLTSDLTGRIESPEYYFTKQTPEVSGAMDNLMLTHGWRRFEWDEVISGKHPVEHLPEVKEHIVTATVTKDGQPARHVFTHLGSPGKIIRAYGSWSNAKGLVHFEIKDFYGPRKVILQAARSNASSAGSDAGADSTARYDIVIKDPFYSAMDAEQLSSLALSPGLRQSLVARSIAMQVQDIFYYEQSASHVELPDVDSSAFYGRADATYYLDDYTRFPVMEEVMREYVPGVFVRKRKDGFHFIVINGVNGGILYGDPMVLVDGVPVLDVDNVMKMDPMRVKKLEVVTRSYYLGQSTFPGIVSYTTYQGDLGGMGLDPQAISLNYEGLQLQRKFFKPEYPREKLADRRPDQRYMLHWEPEITMQRDGTAKVEFYTSDVPGQYRIIVEGLDENGYSGSCTDTFTVKAADNP